MTVGNGEGAGADAKDEGAGRMNPGEVGSSGFWVG